MHSLELHNNWRIQSSTDVQSNGSDVSTETFNDSHWLSASVPSTVLAVIAGDHLADGSSFDYFYGTNWLNLPGSGPYYPIGKNYSDYEIPPTSPFGHPWWYRTRFEISKDEAYQFADLNLKGVTYGAEIWLNGNLIATPAQTKGTYRQFTFDVTPLLNPGSNTLAILVSPPLKSDLTPNWVDWNITPQDKNMGLWREVFLRFHGPVSINHPFVSSELSFSKKTTANLKITAELKNNSGRSVRGRLWAKTLGFSVYQNVELKPQEIKQFEFKSTDFSELKIQNPKLWWPWQMGRPVMHQLETTFEIDQNISDSKSIEYGIRKVESVLTRDGYRLFKINKKPLFIRGGGWASDILLRFSKDREKKELEYARLLGLNTIRLEGRFEPESFYTMADHMGLLLMPGWVCCGSWQNNADWPKDNYGIARDSLRDQLLELRTHPSMLTFLYGSDEAPPADLEKMYLDAIQSTQWPNPTLSAASSQDTLVGPSGVKMTGPYWYTPPSYWYSDFSKKFGGAWGFNTETSPGVSMPPIESLRRFIPPDHFQNVDDTWNFHMGVNQFTSLAEHQNAIARRYGKSRDIFDFIKKSQVMDYDNHRAMFEAYSVNKYKTTTGIVQWMLNSAWPSLFWHLYDYYLQPGAAFFAVKKANKPLHVQYGLDSREVSVVNSTYEEHKNLHIKAEMIDIDGHIFSSTEHSAAISSDSVRKIAKLREPDTNHCVYFLRLKLLNSLGDEIDDNFYWLSCKKETYDWAATTFMQTPVLSEADFSILESLQNTQLLIRSVSNRDNSAAKVTVTNVGHSLAFFINLRLTNDGHDVLPVDWQDNDFSLLPGESKTINVNTMGQKFSEPLAIHGSAWNVSNF